jgi:hypothetical protein
MGFLDINFRSTRGKEALFSTTIKTEREAIQIMQSGTNKGNKNSVVEVTVSEDLINVKEDKKEIIEMARNIIPLISSLDARPYGLASC